MFCLWGNVCIKWTCLCFQIDLQTFLTLTDQDLKELGITTFGARRKMLLAISGMKQSLYPLQCRDQFSAKISTCNHVSLEFLLFFRADNRLHQLESHPANSPLLKAVHANWLMRFINVSYFVCCRNKPEWSPAVQKARSVIHLTEANFTWIWELIAGRCYRQTCREVQDTSIGANLFRKDIHSNLHQQQQLGFGRILLRWLCWCFTSCCSCLPWCWFRFWISWHASTDVNVWGDALH